MCQQDQNKTFNAWGRTSILLVCIFFSQIALTSDSFPDRQELLGKLKDRRYSSLNKTLLAYQEGYEKNQGDERLVAYFAETFANADPESESIMQEWASFSPDNYAPYLVRAYYYYSVAWSWRGYQLNVSEQGSQRMRHYMQLAADDLTRAVEINPRLSAAYAMAIRILTLIGSPELKLQAMNEAMADDPSSYLLHSAFLWSLKPKWGVEADQLSQFMQQTRESVTSNELLGQKLGYEDYVLAESLQEAGRFEDAQVYFDSAIAQGADHIMFRKRGINYYRLKNYEKALSDFDRSLQLWPQEPRVLRWRAYTLWQLERREQALADLELAASLSPYNKYVLMALASFNRQSGVFEGVIDHYINALFYNESDASIWFAKGMHYYRDLLDFQMAAKDLKRAAQLAPDEAKYWYEYSAILHYNLDCDIVDALKHYLALCENGRSCADSEHEWATRAKQWLQESQRCAGGGNIDVENKDSP